MFEVCSSHFVYLPIFVYSLRSAIYGPTITVRGLISAISLTGTPDIMELLAFAGTFNPDLPSIDRNELCLLDSMIPRLA